MSIISKAANEIELIGGVVNMALAGAANAAAAYTFPTGINILGDESLKLKKARITDNGTGGTLVHIGTGTAGAFVDLVPPVRTISGMDMEIDLPEAEAFETITAYPDAVGGSSIDIQLTVTEKV